MKKIILLTSVAVIALLMPADTYRAFAQQTRASPQVQAVGAQGLPAQAAPAQQLGLPLYEDAFQAFLEQYELLADNDQASAFKAEWEHKFDKGDQLSTEEGTKRAIDELTKAGTRLGCPEQPDYKCLYVRALRAYMQYHHSPDSPVKMIDPTE